MSDLKSLRVLLTDQDRPIKILLERRLPDSGPLVLALRSGEEARELLAQQPFDVSQLGFEVPGIGRIETRRRQRQGEESDLLLIESEGRPLQEGELLVSGEAGNSEDQFLTKPMRSRDLQRIVHQIRQGEVDGTTAALLGRAGQEPILGNSDAIRSVLDIVARVAAGQASVLIKGETGTGKTLVARRVHDLSPRAERRFVAINCSAFQDQLLESELFGHEKGSFTGALTAKPGLFEVADGGTLFLDEVGDMSSAMQAKLLQVLDDGELRRVGGRSSTKVDVRVIAASNKDLPQEVKAGKFREDLLFRLNVIHLRVPPLRERREDIPVLIEHFLDRYRLPAQPRKQISPEALQLLSHYAWPGNVRELANTIEGLTLLAPADEIRPEDLPQALRPRTKLELQDSETPLPL
ncbi:MAG: sigma-54 dependent transcriptional regulator, partial [Holophagales bacterium]|nr:sigma-54 dependent transcriptional regulator [Holophagales bacterium]